MCPHFPISGLLSPFFESKKQQPYSISSAFYSQKGTYQKAQKEYKSCPFVPSVPSIPSVSPLSASLKGLFLNTKRERVVIASQKHKFLFIGRVLYPALYSTPLHSTPLHSTPSLCEKSGKWEVVSGKWEMGSGKMRAAFTSDKKEEGLRTKKKKTIHQYLLSRLLYSRFFPISPIELQKNLEENAKINIGSSSFSNSPLIKKSEKFNYFFPYRKSFLCYWLLPFVGFVFTINKNKETKLFHTIIADSSLYFSPFGQDRKLIPYSSTFQEKQNLNDGNYFKKLQNSALPYTPKYVLPEKLGNNKAIFNMETTQQENLISYLLPTVKSNTTDQNYMDIQNNIHIQNNIKEYSNLYLQSLENYVESWTPTLRALPSSSLKSIGISKTSSPSTFVINTFPPSIAYPSILSHLRQGMKVGSNEAIPQLHCFPLSHLSTSHFFPRTEKAKEWESLYSSPLPTFFAKQKGGTNKEGAKEVHIAPFKSNLSFRRKRLKSIWLNLDVCVAVSSFNQPNNNPSTFVFNSSKNPKKSVTVMDFNHKKIRCLQALFLDQKFDSDFYNTTGFLNQPKKNLLLPFSPLEDSRKEYTKNITHLNPVFSFLKTSFLLDNFTKTELLNLPLVDRPKQEISSPHFSLLVYTPPKGNLVANSIKGTEGKIAPSLFIKPLLLLRRALLNKNPSSLSSLMSNFPEGLSSASEGIAVSLYSSPAAYSQSNPHSFALQKKWEVESRESGKQEGAKERREGLPFQTKTKRFLPKKEKGMIDFVVSSFSSHSEEKGGQESKAKKRETKLSKEQLYKLLLNSFSKSFTLSPNYLKTEMPVPSLILNKEESKESTLFLEGKSKKNIINLPKNIKMSYPILITSHLFLKEKQNSSLFTNTSLHICEKNNFPCFNLQKKFIKRTFTPVHNANSGMNDGSLCFHKVDHQAPVLHFEGTSLEKQEEQRENGVIKTALSSRKISLIKKGEEQRMAASSYMFSVSDKVKSQIKIKSEKESSFQKYNYEGNQASFSKNNEEKEYKIKQLKVNNYPFFGILDKYLKINPKSEILSRSGKWEGDHKEGEQLYPVVSSPSVYRAATKKIKKKLFPYGRQTKAGMPNEYLHYSAFVKTYTNKFKNLLLINQLKNSSLPCSVQKKHIAVKKMFTASTDSLNISLNLNTNTEVKNLEVNGKQEAIDKTRATKIEKLLRTYFSIKNKGTLKFASSFNSVNGRSEGRPSILKSASFKISFYDKIKQQLSGVRFPTLSSSALPYTSAKGSEKGSEMSKTWGSLEEEGKAFSSQQYIKENGKKEIRMNNKQKKDDKYFQFFLKGKVYTPRLLIKNRSFILRSNSFPTEKMEEVFASTPSMAYRMEAKQWSNNQASLPIYELEKKQLSSLLPFYKRNKVKNTLQSQKILPQLNVSLSDDLYTVILQKEIINEGEASLYPVNSSNSLDKTANSQETNLEKQRKLIQKKRRRKKLKKETRRRKKRKRFYPRPVWLRYRLFLKLLNKRKNTDSFSNPIVYSPVLSLNNTQTKPTNFFFKNSAVPSPSPSPSIGKKRIDIREEKRKKEISMHTTKKENFTISRPILGDFKRLLWKSYWLRSNLNPYLKRVKTFLTQMKENTQKWELFKNFKVLLNYMGGFSSFTNNFATASRLPERSGSAKLELASFGSSKSFPQFCSQKANSTSVPCTPNSVLFPFIYKGKGGEGKGGNEYYNSNGFNQWENTLYFAEYNRITYHRIQEFISQIRENFATLGFFSLLQNPSPSQGKKVMESLSPSQDNSIEEKDSSLHKAIKEKKENVNSLLSLREENTKVSTNTKKFLKVRSSHISHSKIQDNKREDILSKRKTTDFWVKLGKAIMAENQSASPIGQQTYFKINREWWLFPSYLHKGIPSLTKQGAASLGFCLPKEKPTIPQLRILWALSKTTPSLHLESASDGLVNRDQNNKLKTNISSYLYKRKQTWVEAGKSREQTKYNKTKKMYRDLSMKFQTLLNEQYELISQLLVLPSLLEPKDLVVSSSSSLFNKNKNVPFSSFSQGTSLSVQSNEDPTSKAFSEAIESFLEGQRSEVLRSFILRNNKAIKQEGEGKEKTKSNLVVTKKLEEGTQSYNKLFNKLFKKIRQKEEKYEFLNKRNNNLFLNKREIHEYKKLLQGNKKDWSFYAPNAYSSKKDLSPYTLLHTETHIKKGDVRFFHKEGKRSSDQISSFLRYAPQKGNKQKQNETWLNNLTGKSSYWWTSQETKNLFSFSHQNKHQKKTLFDPSAFSLGSSQSNPFLQWGNAQGHVQSSFIQTENNKKIAMTLSIPSFYKGIQEAKEENGTLVPWAREEQSKPFYLKTAWICALLFHFCSILSLLSISQIRGLLKFYLLGISKIYKTSLGILEYSYTSFSHFQLGTMLSTFPSQSEEGDSKSLLKGNNKKQSKGFIPTLTLRAREGRTNRDVVYSNEAKQNKQNEQAKEQNKKEEKAYLILDKVIGNSLNKSISVDLIKYYLNKDKSFSKLFLSSPTPNVPFSQEIPFASPPPHLIVDNFANKKGESFKKDEEASFVSLLERYVDNKDKSTQSFLKNHEKKNQSFLALKIIACSKRERNLASLPFGLVLSEKSKNGSFREIFMRASKKPQTTQPSFSNSIENAAFIKSENFSLTGPSEGKSLFKEKLDVNNEISKERTILQKKMEFLFTITSLFLCSLKKAQKNFFFVKPTFSSLFNMESSLSLPTSNFIDLPPSQQPPLFIVDIVDSFAKKVGSGSKERKSERKEGKVSNKHKNYTTLYSLYILNFLINNFYNIGSGTKTVFKQTFDVISRFGPKSILTFLEKPGELIIDWIAYMFLVEWSSDITNTIPENVDIYVGTSYYKLTRTLLPHSLNFFPLKNINNSNNFSKGIGNKGEITILNLGSTFIQNRIYHLYEILLFQFYQPDTDLIVRQKKGIIFWDIWGDFLMQVAEDSNINISELTSLKEEQIKLLEKSSEFESLQSTKQNTKEKSSMLLPFEQKNLYKEKNTTLLSHLLITLLPGAPKMEETKGKRVPSLSFQFSSLLGGKKVSSFQGSFGAKQKAPVRREGGKLRIQKQDEPNNILTNSLIPSVKNNNFAAQQFLSYQGKDTELFIDLHPPKSFSMISLLKKNESVQTSIGSLVCQIFSGIMSKQISKNILIVGGVSNTKESSHNFNFAPLISSDGSFIPLWDRNIHNLKSRSSFFASQVEGIEGSGNIEINNNFKYNSLPLIGSHSTEGLARSPYESKGNTESPRWPPQSGGLSFHTEEQQNNNQHEKTLLIQAIAGETELKIITDNAYRYAMVYRGVAVGIKLLRDVFDSLSLHTPCLFLIEDIHAIGERRPLLISDDEKGASPNGKPIFGSQREEIHEKNQVLYQLSKHVISHYRKPYKGDFSLLIPTNRFCFDLFSPLMLRNVGNSSVSSSLSFASPKIFVQSKSGSSSVAASSVGGETNDSAVETGKENSALPFSGGAGKAVRGAQQKSRLLIKSSQLFAPPATSPFSVLNLKEDKKFKPYKIVSEMPWGGLPGEQLAQISKASYSIRVKVAVLADMAISTLSVKLDMITDLLVIIDSVKGNHGFVVFATTHVPSILDPALRRPGRLDETITLGLFPNLLSRWDILKSSFGLFITGKEQTGFKKGISFDLTYSIGSSVLPLLSFVKPPFFPLVDFSSPVLFFSPFPYLSNKTLSNKTGKNAMQELTFSKKDKLKSKEQKSSLKLKTFDISSKSLLANNQNLKSLDSYLSKKSFGALYAEINKKTYRNNKKRIKILSQTYFIASNMLYEANVNENRMLPMYKEITPSLNPKTVHTDHMNHMDQTQGKFFDLILNRFIASSPYSSPSSSLIRSNKEEKKSNFLDFLQPLNKETSSLYISLYASPQQFKNHIIKLMSGKLGEMFLLSQPLLNNTDTPLSASRVLWAKPGPQMPSLVPPNSTKEKGVYDHTFNGQGVDNQGLTSEAMKQRLTKGCALGVGGTKQLNLFSFTNTYIYNNNSNAETFTSLGLSNTWKLLSSLILSFVQKRYLYNNNLIVPKFLDFNNKNSLYEPPSPPSSNILLPARRYENYRRSFAFFSGRKISMNIMEKIQAHQQQRLVKRLYGFPVKESFNSEIRTYSSFLRHNEKKPSTFTSMFEPSGVSKGLTSLKEDKQENSFTSFTNATLMIGSLSSVLQKPSNSNWFIKNRILMRHKNYLTNQWWNGQLPEHNAETTFLSDIDWRYSFVESIGDLLLDFPDADQHYNPRNRRWLLTKGDYHNWFNFEKNYYSEIYTHFIFDSFIKAYHLYEENREVLDFYAFYILKKGLYNISTPSEIETITLYKRFFLHIATPSPSMAAHRR